MIAFTTATPFRLVRRLAAAGAGSRSLYLLISEVDTMDTVRADVADEIQVQLGVNFRSLLASEVPTERLDDAFAPDDAVVLIILDRWAPKLVDWLDRNIVLLAGPRAVLLLASHEVAERALPAAPNLRNRLTDILVMRPDEALRGDRA